MKSTYMCFLKDFKENRPRLALILRLTAIVGIDMISDNKIGVDTEVNGHSWD